MGGATDRPLGGGRRSRARATGRLTLLLDSEALPAIAHGPENRRDRVRALVTEMRRRGLPVGTVAAVLAEVVRGRPEDAGVFSALRRERVEVHPVDTRVGVRVGQLLGRIGAGSEMAVDAFTVAVADLAGGAVVATSDAGDFGRLAAYAGRVSVADIGEGQRAASDRTRNPSVVLLDPSIHHDHLNGAASDRTWKPGVVRGMA